MFEWENVVFESVIYETPTRSCIVRRCTYQGVPVVIKELNFSSGEEAEKVENEVRLQMSFEHPRVCKVKSYKFEGGSKAFILLESMERDLFKEIEIRKKRGEKWTDEKLIHHFRSLTNAFAAAQQIGICHRDIKPQNIFLKDHELYVADFGCAKKTDLNFTSTVLGSPYFFSPELKKAFLNAVQGDMKSILYNPYKSDVYSLGLTFLFMCNLGPSDELTDLRSLKSATAGALGKLGTCDEIKQLLTLMLKVQADERPDFLDLESYFSTRYPLKQSDSSSYQTPGSDIGNGEFQQAEQMLYMLNNSSLDDIHQTLTYCFAYTGTCLSVQSMIAVQCRYCSNVYQIDLSTAYTAEYLSFCSQYCYCSYNQQTPPGSTCMMCQSQFIPTTDWHSAARSDEINLNALCSLSCYEALRHELGGEPEERKQMYTDSLIPALKIYHCTECGQAFLSSTDWHHWANAKAVLHSLDLNQFCSLGCFYAQIPQQEQFPPLDPHSLDVQSHIHGNYFTTDTHIDAPAKHIAQTRPPSAGTRARPATGNIRSNQVRKETTQQRVLNKRIAVPGKLPVERLLPVPKRSLPISISNKRWCVNCGYKDAESIECLLEHHPICSKCAKKGSCLKCTLEKLKSKCTNCGAEAPGKKCAGTRDKQGKLIQHLLCATCRKAGSRGECKLCRISSS